MAVRLQGKLAVLLLLALFGACTLRTPPRKPSATPTANTSQCERIGQTRLSKKDGAIMLCVPAGEFVMGAADSDTLADKNERPQRHIYIDAFWIDRTEVSNAAFNRCVQAGGCHPKIYDDHALTYTPYAVHPESQNYPAFVYESDVAVEYCNWAGRSLPTEAQWEKAARGSDARLYPWGNETATCDQASFFGCENTLKPFREEGPRCSNTNYCRTMPVDDYPTGASPYGALNMAGNVWEWVNDWYAPYDSGAATRNPTGPTQGQDRVRRGGGATTLAYQLRVTTRASGTAQHFFDNQMGFRCALNER